MIGVATALRTWLRQQGIDADKATLRIVFGDLEDVERADAAMKREIEPYLVAKVDKPDSKNYINGIAVEVKWGQ